MVAAWFCCRLTRCQLACCLRHTCRALLLLENACFACPDNEALLLEVQVRSGVEPLISTAGAWPFASKTQCIDLRFHKSGLDCIAGMCKRSCVELVHVRRIQAAAQAWSAGLCSSWGCSPARR